MTLVQISDGAWELPRTGAMRVPGHVFVSRAQAAELQSESCLANLERLAALPGVVRALAWPSACSRGDSPNGTLTAVDPRAGGGIAPEAIGLDLHCGVRLHVVRGVRTKKVREHRGELAKALADAIPAGPGRVGAIALKAHELDQVARLGAHWAVERKLGVERDLERAEDGGRVAWAEPKGVSADARIRAAPQLGTLGSGGHFIELSVIEELFDEPGARALGLEGGGLTAAFHTGSRAFGQQVSTDWRARLRASARARAHELADDALASALFDSDEGRACFDAFGAAMNFALANRQVITHRLREVLQRAFGELEVELLAESSHNGIRLEHHRIDGSERELLVHRHGTTRAFGPDHASLPLPQRALGTPLFLPGGIGHDSYLLLATSEAELRTLASCPHAHPRLLSSADCRTRAATRDLTREFAGHGLSLRAATHHSLADELPGARADALATLDLLTQLDLARPLARLRPFVLVKG